MQIAKEESIQTSTIMAVLAQEIWKMLKEAVPELVLDHGLKTILNVRNNIISVNFELIFIVADEDKLYMRLAPGTNFSIEDTQKANQVVAFLERYREYAEFSENQKEMLACYRLLGAMYMRKSRAEEGYKAYVEALKLAKELAMDRSKMNMEVLCQVYRELAASLVELQGWSAGAESLGCVRDIREELMKNDHAMAPQFANACYEHAYALNSAENWQQAESEYIRAIEVYEQLADENTEFSDEYKYQAAYACLMLGVMYHNFKDADQGIQTILCGKEVCNDLALQKPDVYLPRLGLFHQVLCSIYQMHEQWESALDSAQCHINILEILEKQHPGDYTGELEMANQQISRINRILFPQ